MTVIIKSFSAHLKLENVNKVIFYWNSRNLQDVNTLTFS